MASALEGDLVRFLREIIAIPSFGGGEGAVIDRLKREMEACGYDEVWTDPMGNLFGRLGTGARLLAVDGHCDTVGAGSPDGWKIDPFKGDHRDGVIYGRGASDQKGGLASAIYAGKILKDAGLPEDMSLLVAATVLEEDYEGLCWQYIVREDKIVPDAVLLTEPTGLGIRIGQRGRMEIKVQTWGKSCHGSAPDRGENAIYKIAPIIQDIERLNARLSAPPVLGKGTIAVTDVRSTAPSLCAVADSATIHLDRRLTEGETPESALEEVRRLPSVAAAHARLTVPEYDARSYTGLTYPVKACCPMWLMERTHPLVDAAAQAYQSLFNEPAGIDVWAFSTNGVATKGVFDIPTIGFGPGEEKYAHTAEDRVRSADLVKAVAFYAAFARQWGRER